jgi:hypothetical protein
METAHQMLKRAIELGRVERIALRLQARNGGVENHHMGGRWIRRGVTGTLPMCGRRKIQSCAVSSCADGRAHEVGA